MQHGEDIRLAGRGRGRNGPALLSPSRPPAPPRSGRLRGPLTSAIGLLIVVGVLRLVLAAVTPLVPDETYYWEWSRRLATGYFDHPPAIAFLIAAGTALFGNTPFGVRFFPVLAGVGAAGLLVALAARHGGPRAALRAAIITSCVPLAAAGLVLATPDAPLFFALALTLLLLDRAVGARPRTPASLGWWIAAGAALGLALLGKYTAVLLPLGVLCAVVARRTLRRWLRVPEPYLAGLAALAVFSPTMLWNAANEWASFRFQIGNGFGGGGGSVVGRVLELLGPQLGLVSPILLAMLAAAVYESLQRRASDRRFLLATIATVIFLFFACTALRHRVEANWPAPAYLPALVLLALLAGRSAWQRWLRAGAALGAGLVLLVYAQALYPVLPVAPAKDPVARAHGWEAPARAAQQAAAGTRVPAGGRVWFAANRYQDASQLAFHVPGNPEVFSLNLGSRPNQYDFWSGFRDRARSGDPLVLVLDASNPQPVIRRLGPHFDRVRRTAQVELRRGDGVVDRRTVWLLEGWHGSWPATE